MSGAMHRRGALAGLVSVGLTAAASAQQAAPVLQGFATPEAAAVALTEAIRRLDGKAVAAILGDRWREFIPTDDKDFGRDRPTYLAGWDEIHHVKVDGDKAIVEVGKTGWTLPVPIVKGGSEWRFDVAAGLDELAAREFGRNELGAIQTLMAIADAQRDYAAMDPMKTGSPVYARRLLASPGRMDGLYWPSAAGRPQSPLGVQVAHSQGDGLTPGAHYGYNYRLLYGQGPAARGGAHDYLVKDRLIGGFAAIAWPKRYGETGIMTFIMGYDGVVYQQDLGTETAQRAATILTFNPDKGWEKADMALP